MMKIYMLMSTETDDQYFPVKFKLHKEIFTDKNEAIKMAKDLGCSVIQFGEEEFWSTSEVKEHEN